MKNRITELRKKKGMTSRALGEALGITQQAISQYEKEIREPKLDTWQKLADALGVSAPYLMGFDMICPLCGSRIGKKSTEEEE